MLELLCAQYIQARDLNNLGGQVEGGGKTNKELSERLSKSDGEQKIACIATWAHIH
jgi:hypothetical protein